MHAIRFILCLGLLITMFGQDSKAQQTILVQDFEKNITLGKWPTNSKGDVTFSTEWKADGKRSVRIDPKLMYAMGDLITKNVKGYTVLRIHIMNSSDKTAKVGFELQDQHKQFHERHQNAFGVKPGEHVIEMDISGGLWRGEENKPYQGKIKKPINMDKLSRISFYNHGDKPIFIDKIEGVKIPKIETKGGFAFDFGKAGTQVMSQMTGADNKMSYNKQRGYGFAGGGLSVLGKAMSFPSPMLGTGVGLQNASFNVDLPGGDYIGLVAFERGGFWSDEYTVYESLSLKANGAEVHNHTFSRDGNAFHFQDTEITNEEEILTKLIWPAHEISEFKFTAKKGTNVFTNTAKGSIKYPPRIAGLILAPDTAEGKEFIKKHIAHQKKTILQTLAYSDKSRKKGRTTPGKDIIARVMEAGDMVYPGDLPTGSDTTLPKKQVAVAGQTVTIQLGLYAKKSTTVTVKAGNESAKISHGRYMPQRTYGVGSVWIEINHFRPEGDFDIAPDKARALLIEYPIAKDSKKGTLKDEVTISSSAGNIKVPIEIDVLPIALEDIPIPVGLYFSGIQIDPKVMDSSAWWALQESVVKEQMNAGITCLSGGPGTRYNISKSSSGYQITGDSALRYVRLGQKHGTLHGTVGYGGLTGSVKGFRYDPVSFVKSWQAFEKANNLPAHIFNAYDEPRRNTDQAKRVTNYLKPYTKAGLKSAGWTSAHFGEPDWEALVDASYAAAYNGHKAGDLAKLKKRGVSPWVYNNGLDRYGMGLHLWRGVKFGAEGRMQWIGLFSQGFAFHNLDGREPSHSCFMVHKKFGACPTANWLGVREGLLDARIRFTLEKHAKTGDKALDIWKVDAAAYRKDQGTWTNAKLQESREAMLKRLQEIL